MSQRAESLRALITSPGCTPVAPIFDGLSARIAETMGWAAGKLPGSTSRFANFGVPDGVALGNSSDLYEICNHIGRMSDLSLIVDADDGGTPLQVRRAVRDLEAAGVAALEVDDLVTPRHFTESPELAPVDIQVAKLSSAVESRRDESMMIVGRTSALQLLDLDDALSKITEYIATGIDALMLPGLRAGGISADPRAHIEAMQRLSSLPLFVSGLPEDLARDTEWLEAQRIKLLFHGHHTYKMAVRAIHDALEHLQQGRDPAELAGRYATPDILNSVVGLTDIVKWDLTYSDADETSTPLLLEP